VKAAAPRPPVYGVLAEFDDPGTLLGAARRAHEAGWRDLDAFTPFPVHGLAEAIGFHKTRVPLITLVGGLTGLVAGFALQYWVHVIAYPMNVGGRPFNSWPAFVPVTFECTILLAAFSAVMGMLALNGLPRPHHPLFNVPAFQLASQDRFFLCLESKDPKFEHEEARRFLAGLGGRVFDVDWD
jgi:hypothetical protein